ncbi:MAG: caspase family protein [Spirochaetota bacterium]
MEQSLADFQKLLKGKEAALFYYAGHGVQVGGENFLIPAKEHIRSEVQVKTKAVALGDLMDRVKTSGVRTALVFLDACRDNPFPGSSRSGTRGLAVVAPLAEVETCIASATQPGNTAQDGNGRNGVFTAAMLKNLGTAGASLSGLMTSATADVKLTTTGKQQPRMDSGLSKPFSFVDPAVAAAQAQSALD